MIRAWLLNYRPLDQHLASEAAAAAAPLPVQLAAALARGNGVQAEWAVLATCHRCEVYTHGASGSLVGGVLDDVFPAAARSTVAEVAAEEAVRHLMRVAAGLDSMLLGETDVQHQVVAAWQDAAAGGSTGAVLDALFRAAIHAGKRVRTDTGIGRHATSLAPAAVDLVAGRLASVGEARALVFGAGTMAQRACERLRDLGFGSLTVTSRTLERAERLAHRCGGRAVPWGPAAALRSADVAIAATAAPTPFIDDAMLSAVMTDRRRALHLVDLALPQNVDRGATPLPGFTYYDFADLEAATRASHAARTAEVPLAEAVIEQELARFRSWWQQREIAPALRLLGELAAATRDAELERVWRRLPGLTDRERRIVESLAHNVTRGLLRRPMTRLRDAAGTALAGQYRGTLESLFADRPPRDPP
ncbi:MAG: glutamyl-tRNA reductase [Spirochaetaceae bacterium]|nr:glutamyl-tRNA reductase [Spirochaetaceae bacterium]